MAFCVVCSLRKFCRHQTNSGQLQLFPDVTTELEDLRKFSLSALGTLLAVLAISGSKTLQPVVLILLIYTINLRLVVNTCILCNYPMVARFLHVILLLGTCCTAGVVLVSDLHSPALAAVGLSLGVLPLVTIAIHHGRQCGGTSTTELSLQMSAPAEPGLASAILPN